MCCKKRVTIFPSPAGDVTNLILQSNLAFKSIVTTDSEAFNLPFFALFRCGGEEIFVHVSDRGGICVGDLIYD